MLLLCFKAGVNILSAKYHSLKPVPKLKIKQGGYLLNLITTTTVVANENAPVVANENAPEYVRK